MREGRFCAKVRVSFSLVTNTKLLHSLRCRSVRIRLVTDSGFASGLLDGLPKLIKEEGFLSQFNGLAAMLLKQCPYTLGKQVR